MEWFKKHSDAAVVLSTIIGCFFWMNVQFNHMDHRFNELEKDIVMIKTVLIMKNIMPNELATGEKEGK